MFVTYDICMLLIWTHKFIIFLTDSYNIIIIFFIKMVIKLDTYLYTHIYMNVFISHYMHIKNFDGFHL